MRISVITPTLHRPKSHALLDRVWGEQMYQPYEHIILEESWSADRHGVGFANSFVKYIKLPDTRARNMLALVNTGLKLNQGMDIATGDLLVFAGNDDYYAPGYLAGIAALFTRKPKVLFSCCAKMKYWNIVHDYGFYNAAASNGGGFVLRNNALAANFRYNDTRAGEDTAFRSLIRNSPLTTADQINTTPYNANIVVSRHSEQHHHIWMRAGLSATAETLEQWIPDAITRRLFMEAV